MSGEPVALTAARRLILNCLATTNPRGLPLKTPDFDQDDVKRLQEARLIRYEAWPGSRLWFITNDGLNLVRTLQASSEG